MRPFGIFLLFLASPSLAQTPIHEGRAASSTAAIRITVPAGAVRVTAWDHDSVAVNGRLDRLAGDFYFGGTRESLKLGVEPRKGGSSAAIADLDVKVPAGCRLWIKTASGTVDITGGGGMIEVLIGAGRVRFDGEASEFVAESIDGNIELTGRAADGRLRTASGIIVARGVVRELSASSVSGPLLIGMEGAVSRVALETVSGEIAFKGDLDTDGVLQADTHGGDIELRLPPHLGARYNVVSYGRGLVNQLVPSGLVKEDPRGQWHFVTGKGSATVNVRTFKGKVVLLPKGEESSGLP